MTVSSQVVSCSTTACAFNNGGCTAFAISVGGTGSQASCLTFANIDARAQLSTPAGQVATCSRIECVHNSDLVCTAGKIEIGGDTASCESYQAA